MRWIHWFPRIFYHVLFSAIVSYSLCCGIWLVRIKVYDLLGIDNSRLFFPVFIRSNIILGHCDLHNFSISNSNSNVDDYDDKNGYLVLIICFPLFRDYSHHVDFVYRYLLFFCYHKM